MSASKKPTKTDLLRENEELRQRLAEAEETLRAIREGEVDAVIVSSARGEQVFSLAGADLIYRLIVETMTEAAFTATLDGRILFCNAQFGQFVKRPLEQIVGHPLQEVVAENNRAAACGLLTAARKRPVRQRLVFQSADGAAVPAHVAANVLNQPDGQSICVVASDLTELENSTELIDRLRRQGEELRQSRERLTRAQEIAHVGSWELDLAGNELSWSDEVYRIFGLRPQEFGATYEAFLDCVHPDDRAAVDAAYSGSLREGRDAYEIEHRVVRKGTGEIRAVHEKCRHIRDSAGEIVRSVGMVHDITERKRGEEKLRQSEERFRQLVNHAPIPLGFVNKEGALVYLNDRFVQTLGYSLQDVPTLKEWWLLAYPDEGYRRWVVATWEAAVKRAARGKTDIQPTEYNVTCKDGTVRVMEISGITVEEGILAAFIDITERKRAEEALRRGAEELARVQRDLEQFAYVASHDLQEPLRMVRSFMELLKERYQGKLDGTADEYIGLAVDGAKRMSELIQDLLAYSRVGSGGKHPRPTSVEDALQKAMASLLTSIREQGARVSHDPLPVVVADPAQLTQLLQNLIGNAIKFHRDGVPPEIHVGARPDGGRWVLSVRDNGIGISPEQQHRVFQVFQRLHGRDKYPGTGIGLAICKRIVERHGGRIWLESNPGEGSTFHFTLPGH